jgi:hypothetical protein
MMRPIPLDSHLIYKAEVGYAVLVCIVEDVTTATVRAEWDPFVTLGEVVEAAEGTQATLEAAHIAAPVVARVADETQPTITKATPDVMQWTAETAADAWDWTSEAAEAAWEKTDKHRQKVENWFKEKGQILGMLGICMLDRGNIFKQGWRGGAGAYTANKWGTSGWFSRGFAVGSAAQGAGLGLAVRVWADEIWCMGSMAPGAPGSQPQWAWE